MSTSDNLNTLRALQRFYRKNGLRFGVSVNIPASPTTTYIVKTFTATGTYTVTTGKTLFMTDLSGEGNSTGSELDIEIPSGTVVFRVKPQASTLSYQLQSPLVANSGTVIKFNFIIALVSFNFTGYEV